ncbi:hypothetical protein QMK19_19140 [Streptomyces sp. H10-C2]|uniref:hypothetical protein n=1 Tax=unclassified Streptomyces TaxID=2593676 RepID=UPI0024BA3416|nr:MULTISPECIES: hypothetical protein [unclassified Streptomyces]MDJ0346222.1 hypothetical protein [Streptomyces sp. PH10-H1]MDJ0371736.1 hypothetical protein [Streptomyces sp. H10-C2]
MSKQPTVAQRRLIVGADANTGLLRGPQAMLDALCGLGLAVEHPRSPHRCYLTPAGLALRIELLAPPPERPAGPPPVVETFAARTGEVTAGADDPRRAREVRVAWEGLLELRRVTNGVTDRPCAWERAHLVSGAALALEAAGCRPAVADGRGGYVASGYRVGPAHQPEAVRVDWPGIRPPEGPEGPEEAAEAVEAAASAALESAGWQVTEHPDGAGGRFLLASPRRA